MLTLTLVDPLIFPLLLFVRCRSSSSQRGRIPRIGSPSDERRAHQRRQDLKQGQRQRRFNIGFGHLLCVVDRGD